MTTLPAAATLATFPKVRRVRLGISLPQPILRRLREFAAAKGSSQTAIIEALVTEHLAHGGARHSESAPTSPIDNLIEALDLDRAARDAQHRELVDAVEVLSLLFDEFLFFWLWRGAAPSTTNPEARSQAARELFDDLTRRAAERFRSGRRFRKKFVGPGVPASGGADMTRSQGG